jgi:VWFA-related protein
MGMIRTVAVVGCLLLGVASVATAQQPLTFRSAVDRIPVDVAVLDRDGRPVDHLTTSDFTLTVDGQPRTIVSADYVSTRGLNEAPPDRTIFSSNAGQRPGRLIALVIDEAHIGRGTSRAAFAAASRFVRSLDRADRVALYLIPGAGPVTGFTSNHGLVLRLLESAAGQATEAQVSSSVGIAEAIEILDRPPNPDSPTGAPAGSLLEEVFSRECAGQNDAATLATCRRRIEAEARLVFGATRSRTTQSLVALRSVFDQLAITDAPKTVVLLTEGLVLGRDMSDITWVGALATRAQLTLYALRLNGDLFGAESARISPSRRADLDLMTQGLDQLVGSTNGTVLPVAVNASAVFSRLELELSGYYLLSFAPLPGDRDGRTHRIDVRTTAPNVRLRARREFSMAAERPTTRQDYLVDALKSPLGLSDFGLQATTYHYPDAAPRSTQIKVLVAVTLDRTFNRDGDFSLAWYLTDPAGRVVSIQDEARISVASPALAGQPQTFAGAVLVDPGVYSMTIAAVDDSGRRATVEHSFDARLTGVGQIRLSDIMIAHPPADGRTVTPQVDGRISGESLVAYVELASTAEPQLAKATLSLEIARAADDRALETTPMRFVGNEVIGFRRAETQIPVALLADGAYVARVVLSSDGRPIGTVTRPFTLDRGVVAGSATPPPSSSFTPFVDPFDRAEILSRAAVGFFLDQLQLVGGPPLPEALLPALGLSRITRFADAGAIAERAGSSHYAAPFFTGLAALARGDLNRAAEDFGASLTAAPDFLPAAYYLGACYAAAGRDREAVLAWRTALISDSRAPWIYTTMLDALLRTRNVRFALELSADADTRWPDNDAIRVRRATVLALAGQPVQAVQSLAPYLERQSTDLPRLLLVLRMYYEARAGGLVVESVERDRSRFAAYAQQYAAAGGQERDLVAAWQRVMDRE